MKKVLIITYYWPPAGGPGVQRWLKFVKYLREFDWEPVVYTVKNPSYPILDHTLVSEIPEGIEVIKKTIIEPYTFASFITRQKDIDKVKGGFIESDEKQGMMKKLTTWVRGNFFIPDARVFWVDPSVKFLKKYLQTNPVDVVVTTGPPHSLHLIALKLKRQIGIKWVADFRDPWTNIDYYSKLRLSRWADLKHQRLERDVIEESDRVLVVGKTMKEEFYRCGGDKIHVLPNGFDEEIDKHEVIELDKKFTIAHIGSMNADRNPEYLWEAISECIQEDPKIGEDLQIKLAGTVSQEVFDTIAFFNLKNNVYHEKYLNHKDVIRFQKSSQILLLVLNDTPNAKGIVTGKFFEYLNAKRPVLAVGPEDGDLAEILKETSSGIIVDYNKKEEMKALIKRYYSDYKNEDLFVNSNNIAKYSRKNITAKLAGILNSL
ncbi:MAG: glycosyltransferase family 4 protein [Flavobacteriales bacterium]|nr:glycosyltransferase family 4 protein [Flavobacteriales bacterium]